MGCIKIFWDYIPATAAFWSFVIVHNTEHFDLFSNSFWSLSYIRELQRQRCKNLKPHE
jgi:hypothetical protein